MSCPQLALQQVTGLTLFWDFKPSPGSKELTHERLKCALRRPVRAPAHQVLKPVRHHPEWAVLFLYAPQGRLDAAQCFTLDRLKDQGLPLFVVLASASAEQVPSDLAGRCDALYWKALPGFDFSAYRLALTAIARHSPGADVFVMNDSVFGPFSDIRPFLKHAPWDLTGFTASAQMENHLQSYAFVLKNVTRARMRRLASVLFPFMAFNTIHDVIHCQESRLARVAAKTMSVGALWYAGAAAGEALDPPLHSPLALLEAGFPFLKKSLIGKHARFMERSLVEGFLRRHQHPVV